MEKGFILKTIILGKLIILLSFFAVSQNLNPISEKQIQDFRIFKTSLLENSAGLFIYNDSTSVRLLFNDLENNLSHELPERSVYKLYAQFISEIKCGHTQVLPSKKIIRDFFSSPCSLPFDVALSNDKLFALKSYGKDPKINRYDEIISINDKEVKILLPEMKRLIASDGNARNFKNKQLGKFFLLYYYFQEGKKDVFNLKFVSKEKDTSEITIFSAYPNIQEYKKKDESRRLKQLKKEPYGSVKIMKSANYALITLPSFEKSSGRKFKNFVDENFDKIAKSGIEHLIIDLRDNLGGKNQYYLSSFLTRKFIEYDAISCHGNGKPSYNKYLKKYNKDYIICRAYLRKNKLALNDSISAPIIRKGIQPRENAFNGKIYVLINGNTFSAASNLASNLKEKCNAIMIGETSGGGYKQGNTGRLRLLLPKSKLMVIINPIHYDNLPLNKNQEEDGVKPHFVIEEDFPSRKKIDPYMKFALKILLDSPDNIPSNLDSEENVKELDEESN